MKSNRTIVSVALLSSMALVAVPALAAGEFPTNPEKSVAMDPPPAVRSVDEIRAELDAFHRNPVTPDGWIDVGGERGDMLVQHKYAYVDGNYVDTSKSDRDAPERTLSNEEIKIASLDYRNAQ